MDLIKSYDHVNWGFLRLLLQIGLPLGTTDWIITCISFSCSVVLMNGTPSKIFNCTRGLQQGWPLSPLLFLLVIEGLSRLISTTKVEGKIKGIKFSPTLFITHLLFVDDVILFCSSTIEE